MAGGETTLGNINGGNINGGNINGGNGNSGNTLPSNVNKYESLMELFDYLSNMLAYADNEWINGHVEVIFDTQSNSIAIEFTEMDDGDFDTIREAVNE